MSKDMGEYERGLFDAVRYELYRCVRAGVQVTDPINDTDADGNDKDATDIVIGAHAIFNHIAHTLDDLTTLLGDDFPKVLEDETTGDDDTDPTKAPTGDMAAMS